MLGAAPSASYSAWCSPISRVVRVYVGSPYRHLTTQTPTNSLDPYPGRTVVRARSNAETSDPT